MKALSLFVWGALGLACQRSEPAAQPSPSAEPKGAAKAPEAARALIASGAVVIDVRNPDEFAEDHVASAVNIPVGEIGARLEEVARLVANDKTRPVVVYCAVGGRAAKAKAQLETAGYTRVVNGGGIADVKP